MGNPLKVIAKPFTALAGKVDQSVEQKILLSIVRHGVSALGVWMMAHGYLAAAQSGNFDQSAVGFLLAMIAIFSAGKQKINEAS